MLAILLLAAWAFAFPLVIGRPRSWGATAMSLVGLAWLGFGVDIVLRFFVLAYDSVTFGNMTSRLADRPPTLVNQTLVVTLVYLAVFVAVGSISRLAPRPKILASLATGAEKATERSLVPWVVITSACIILATVNEFPDSLVTPVSLVGSLWVFPASIAWWRRLAGFRISDRTLALVLVPGLIRVVLLPYRESLFLVMVIPLFAALVAKRQVRLTLVIAGSAIGLLVSTIVIGTYRQIKWEGVSTSEALSRVSPAYWEEHPMDSPWSGVLRRFHAFDSLLLTVDLVPSVFPYSGRNVFVEGVARGLVPRIAYADKRLDNDGLAFSQTIWGFGDSGNDIAAIAPSMPGNLFEAGGILFVGLGAACWTLLLGWLDRLKKALTPGSAAGIHALFAFQALGGIERDYPHSFSTVLQNLVVLTVVLLIVGRSGTPAPSYPLRLPYPGRDPGPDESTAHVQVKSIYERLDR